MMDMEMHSPAQSDPHLMQQVQQHDTRALQTLYERYTSRALGLAVKILRDRALAEEVAQEAFWRVWQRAKQFEYGRGDFTRWLDGIVRHLALDELRRAKGHVEHGNDEQFEEILAEAASAKQDATDVAELVDARLRKQHVLSALQTLPLLQRQIIELSFFQGLTRREIARQLGVPLGTVHTRAWLGLNKLRDMLDGAAA
jgi:RNA polymerase sigma-70 factor (ECF subfamily)